MQEISKEILEKITHSGALASYKGNLKIKMIQNFIDRGMLEYIRVFDIFLPLSELKLLIINLFMKLDNWHNLGISIDFFCSV